MQYCFFLLFISGCSVFFGSATQAPSAKHFQYNVRFALPTWQLKKDERSDYVFENVKDGRMLVANSFCGEFQDESLKNLAGKTFRTVDGFKILKEDYTTLGNREAYKVEGSGLIDGVQVVVRMLNTRRNNCYFDFVSISPLRAARFPDKAFEEFLSTVEFK